LECVSIGAWTDLADGMLHDISGMAFRKSLTMLSSKRIDCIASFKN
jgi:hypothetical protein